MLGRSAGDAGRTAREFDELFAAFAKFLPKRTFRDKMSLFSGADQIDLDCFGRGHTNGDAFVVFKAARAMCAAQQLSYVPAWIVSI